MSGRGSAGWYRASIHLASVLLSLPGVCEVGVGVVRLSAQGAPGVWPVGPSLAREAPLVLGAGSPVPLKCKECGKGGVGEPGIWV